MDNLDLAIVDLETTGGNAMYHRIIEVAVLKIKAGTVVDSFSTLVDPERAVPPFVERLTGITSESLRGAPTFSQIKDRLFELVNGAVFVAHNARFDYNFLKEEFQREDVEFSAHCLCTVRLSRLLFPEHRRHSLDSIIERHGIICEDRHRAMGDVRAVWDFLNIVKERFGREQVHGAVGTILKTPTLPPNLDESILAALPESPGAYIFYDREKKPIYVGKSVNVRSRVLSHFSGTPPSAKDNALAQEVCDVEVVNTSGELGALLVESYLIKKLHPFYNSRSRYRKRLFAVRKIRNNGAYGTIQITQLGKVTLADLPEIVALFPSLKAARRFVWETTKEFGLCPKITGLERNGEGPCSYTQLRICNGACTGKEAPIPYNLRFEKAFLGRKIRSWPFSGPVLIEEKARNGKKGEIFIVDNWCLVDSFRYDQSGRSRIFQGDYSFDYESYKIICDYLLKSRVPVRFREISQADVQKIREDWQV